VYCAIDEVTQICEDLRGGLGDSNVLIEVMKQRNVNTKRGGVEKGGIELE
jgi:hypothetical protein